jgi:Homeodomain-like domain-containing protein
MSIPCEAGRGKRKERPEPCRLCGAAGWWNGIRVVSAVVCGVAAAVEYASGQVRRRACCSAHGCPAPSWTVYPRGSYPHRTFQLDVVSSAVTQVASGQSVERAAAAHQCSRRSVRRWRKWCAELVAPEQLAMAVARLDADGLPPPARADGERRDEAGWALGLWQRLADVLAQRGVALSAGRSGLQRVLCWQHEREGVVAWLTKAQSPRLRVDLQAVLV